MNHSDSEPSWYGALRVNPLRTRTFTSELAAGIRSRAAEAPAPAARTVSRVAALIGTAAASVAGVLLVLGIMQGEQKAEIPFADTSAGIERQQHSDVMPPSIPGDRPTLPVQSPNDSQWQALVDASYPESKVSMLHKKVLRDDVMLVFSRKVLSAEGYLSASLVVDEFEWSSSGWKSQARVGYHPGDNLLEYSGKGLLTGWSGISLDPEDSGQFVTMFYGIIADPAIVDIRVTEDGGSVHAASVHDAGDGFAYWLAALPPGEKGSYTVTGASEDGTILYDEYYYYR